MNQEGTKTCYTCGQTLPLTNFYKQSKNHTRYRGKCKACADVYHKSRKAQLYSNPVTAEIERAKVRKYINGRGKAVDTLEGRKRRFVSWQKRYPEKYAARGVCQRFPKLKGMHNHHWSYAVAHRTDTIKLPIPWHRLLHRHLIYDQSHMMYRKPDGTLIDSREATMSYCLTLLPKIPMIPKNRNLLKLSYNRGDDYE